MQKGFRNEIDFVISLNNKKYGDLSIEFKSLLSKLFKNLNTDTNIICWQSKYSEKADIKIKINNEIKGVSIKCGARAMGLFDCDCLAEGKLADLVLLDLKQPNMQPENNIIKNFNDFIKGYVKGNKVDAKTYINNNKEEIAEIIDSFNKLYVKINLILRFIFQGTELQKYDCDAIIYGTPSKFLWATKNEVIEYLVNYDTISIYQIGLSALSIKCYDRNLKNNQSRINCTEDIQVKWYTFKKDLLYLTKIREAKSIQLYN